MQTELKYGIINIGGRMQGFITHKHIVSEARVIIRELGFKFWLTVLLVAYAEVILQRKPYTTFLNMLIRYNHLIKVKGK